jgi:hypothetical protein
MSSHVGTGNIPDSENPGKFHLKIDTHSIELWVVSLGPDIEGMYVYMYLYLYVNG